MLPGIFIMLFGIVLTFVSTYVVWMGQKSKNWPRTLGVLLSAKIKMDQSEGRDGSLTYSNSASVRYKYTVNETSYISERIGFGTSGFSNASEMEVRLWLLDRQWKAGNQIPVYYNPRKPRESVLVPGIYGSYYLALLAGIALTLIGIAVIIVKPAFW